MTDTTDFRAALVHARETEPSAAELDALRRALGHPSRRRRRRRRRPRRGMVALLVAAGLIIPASAIAAGPVSDAFESFLGLTESTPVDVDLRSGTTIDEHDGVRFSVSRSAPDDVCLSLNGSVEICGNPRDGAWQDQLSDRAVVPVGTIAPREGDDAPLFLLTAPGAASVSVAYEVGQPTSRRVGNGGAVVLADPARRPTTAIVYDRSGAELGRADISDRQWEWCRNEAGCPEMNG